MGKVVEIAWVISTRQTTWDTTPVASARRSVPRQIFGVGLNYSGHAGESGMAPTFR